MVPGTNPRRPQAPRRCQGIKSHRRQVQPSQFPRQHFGFTAIAVDEGFWQVRNFWPLTGQLFGPDAVAGHKRQVVLGAELAKKIFGNTHIQGRDLEINQEIYRISGVLGGVTDSGLANSVFLPLTTAEDRFQGRLLADRVYLRCNTWDDVGTVAAAIPGVVKSCQSSEELHVEVAREALKRVQLLAWWIEFLVYLTIGATFVLGGVGIWNVMMAAVRSRTREIGLKKAMGAEDRDILAQFLSEALCLSLSAALGAGLGRSDGELGFGSAAIPRRISFSRHRPGAPVCGDTRGRSRALSFHPGSSHGSGIRHPL